jgi:hypothetical protein
MGGLISTYAAIEYPHIFGKVGNLSPAYWFSNDSCNIQILNRGKRNDQKFYFVSGTNESADMLPDMQKVYQSLTQVGFINTNLNLLTRSDGQHAEWFWAREFGPTYQWLFKNWSIDCGVFYFYAGSQTAGNTYQWQVDAGEGFNNISNSNIYSGTTQNTLTIKNTPTSYVDYQYRCIITQGQIKDTSTIQTIRFTDTWTGASDTLWNNPANWSCGMIPNEKMDVIIQLTPKQPVLTTDGICRTLKQEPGTSIKVNTNYNLTIVE